jgi:hypothetical protein
LAILSRTIKKQGGRYQDEQIDRLLVVEQPYSSFFPPGKATSRVAFAFMLLDDIFLAGVEKNPTHLLPWAELK